jgi:hypothetical protein
VTLGERFLLQIFEPKFDSSWLALLRNGNAPRNKFYQILQCQVIRSLHAPPLGTVVQLLKGAVIISQVLQVLSNSQILVRSLVKSCSLGDQRLRLRKSYESDPPSTTVPY